jgi:hypothetical protein
VAVEDAAAASAVVADGAAVVDAAVEADGAVAAGGAAEETTMRKGHKTMRSIMLALVLVCSLSTASRVSAQAAKTFASPEEAGGALIAALEANDDKTLVAIFGADSADIVQSGTDPAVAASRRDLAASGRRKLAVDKPDDNHAILEFGEEAWPSPIPLVREGNAWHFDTAAGREELLARRIGKNELMAINICDEYPAVQADYASKERDGDDVLEYAQKLVSSPGKHDGLYWPEKPGEDPSPIGVELDDAAAPVAGAPYAGYYWKILTGQGSHAPGGAYSYIINGNMVAGFALVGTPADYRKTGVMTFLVNNNGKVYQKDLGPTGLDAVKAMQVYDPDSSWTLVPEHDEGEAQ